MSWSAGNGRGGPVCPPAGFPPDPCGDRRGGNLPPGEMWAAGRRPRWCLLPQGLVQRGCTPHFLFGLARKENGPCTVQKKRAPGALRCSGPPRARGSAYRCLLRFRLAFGHAWVFCQVDTAVPWRMVPRSSGCKDAFDQLLFPRVPLRYALPGYSQELLPCPMLQLSSITGQRQRKSAQHVSQPSPGQRFPQGPGVSVPDRRAGPPTFPRRRKEVCAGADRPAEAFFLFGPCTARFSFGKTKREMGGALPSYQHS